MSSNKAVIYARVSSTGERQSTARQVADLRKYASASGLEVVKVYEEKASGAKVNREVLAECLESIRKGEADTLLVTELSRLGRSLKQVLEVVEDLTERKVNICFQAQGLNTIVDRLQSGRRVATEKGVRMGRKVGYHLSDREVLAKYPKVVRKLKGGFSVRETAKVCGVSVWTVQKIKKILN